MYNDIQNRLFLGSVIPVLIVLICLLSVSWMSVSVQAKTLHDPTRPPGSSVHQSGRQVEKKKSPWRLSSTLIAKHRSIATINGQLIRPGERINGAVLIDIQRWNVTLQRNNKKFKVYMFNKRHSKKMVR